MGDYHQEQYAKHVKKYGIDFVSYPERTSSSTREKCSKCDQPPQYECNLLGQGKFLCPGHTKRFMAKNSSLPANLWFAVKMKEPKRS